MHIEINLEKIRHNSSKIWAIARKNGLTVMGVTKGCLGDSVIAKAIEEGGIKKFGDSRIINIKKLITAGFEDLTLIRQPNMQEIREIAGKVKNIYISNLEGANALSIEAQKTGIIQNIVLLVETGDYRDGFIVGDLIKSLDKIKRLKGINIRGIATNTACANKVRINPNGVKEIVEIAEKLNLKNIEISSLNSSSISLLEDKKIPEAVTEIRIGEAILLGLETINYRPVNNLYQDAFVLSADILESSFKNERSQVLISLGVADIGAGKIRPFDFKGEHIKSTSDHSIFRVENYKKFEYGQKLKLLPNYYALLSLMISPYVKKKYIRNVD